MKRAMFNKCHLFCSKLLHIICLPVWSAAWFHQPSKPLTSTAPARTSSPLRATHAEAKTISRFLTRSMDWRRVVVNKQELMPGVEWARVSDSAQGSGLTARVGHLDISSALSGSAAQRPFECASKLNSLHIYLFVLDSYSSIFDVHSLGRKESHHCARMPALWPTLRPECLLYVCLHLGIDASPEEQQEADFMQYEGCSAVHKLGLRREREETKGAQVLCKNCFV